jgi:hypothetical protein
MPRGEYANVEKLAVEIVRSAELARGWTPGPLLSQHDQHEEGCDLLSTPPDSGPPHRIEVKGWGEPLLAENGAFSYPADVNREQFERAKSDPNWRLEIVGNLGAVRAGTGQPERLTLTAKEVVKRAACWRYRVSLDGLADRVQPPSSSTAG